MNRNNAYSEIKSVVQNDKFFIISGPCAIEDEKTAFVIAEHLKEITKNLDIPYIFKGSFKKANRSRIDSFTGIGDIKALTILRKIGKELQIPVTTDIHTSEDAKIAAQYVDILQIPAFLARQTDLLVAAAETGKIVNVKKGQFMSPESMKHAVNKVFDSGNEQILITDRGTMFGYQDLIVDYRGIPTMKKIAPTVLDVTHSLQKPNQNSGITGGNPELIRTIASAGIAAGVNGIFMETHPDPTKAKSDGANMLKLDLAKDLIIHLKKINSVLCK